jgi:hypothetical protein
MRRRCKFSDGLSVAGLSKQHSRKAALISVLKRNGNGRTSPSRERRRRCSDCSPSLRSGRAIQKSRLAFVQDRPGGIVNANLPSATPSPLFEGRSGARRVFQCRGIGRTAWKFQPPSWKDSPTRFATQRKIRKVELRSDSEKALFWKEKLGEKNKPRVGLVWSGGFRPDQPELWPINRRRNIPLAKLAALKNPDIEFYSLQKGQPAESELAELTRDNWGGPEIVDFTSLLNNFSDTAALIENLDLVISVDTSTVHLAGALGKPVWILNRFASCWRWLIDRADSPWYPTVKLYRQEKASDWDAVIQRVKADLLRFHGGSGL